MFTLAVGFTFGFSLAYMLLAGSGLGGRREMFPGPPPQPGDPHSHQVRLETGLTVCHPTSLRTDVCPTGATSALALEKEFLDFILFILFLRPGAGLMKTFVYFYN